MARTIQTFIHLNTEDVYWTPFEGMEFVRSDKVGCVNARTGKVERVRFEDVDWNTFAFNPLFTKIDELGLPKPVIDLDKMMTEYAEAEELRARQEEEMWEAYEETISKTWM